MPLTGSVSCKDAPKKGKSKDKKKKGSSWIGTLDVPLMSLVEEKLSSYSLARQHNPLDIVLIMPSNLDRRTPSLEVRSRIYAIYPTFQETQLFIYNHH